IFYKLMERHRTLYLDWLWIFLGKLFHVIVSGNFSEIFVLSLADTNIENHFFIRLLVLFCEFAIDVREWVISIAIPVDTFHELEWNLSHYSSIHCPWLIIISKPPAIFSI